MRRYELAPLERASADEQLAVISAAFRRPFDAAWYRWKHLEGPWGPSTGVVAVDDQGIAGVRLLVPWALTGPLAPFRVLRATEAATAPRLRGAGAFRAMNEELVRRLAASGADSLLLSTANELSRPAYLKMGWQQLPPFSNAYAPVVPAPTRLREVGADELAELGHPVQAAGIHTAWTVAAVRWRLDERSGHRYAVHALAQSDHPVAMAYRVTGSRLRVLVPIFEWGDPKGLARLRRGIAWHTRAVAVLGAHGEGTRSLRAAPARPRGSSVIIMRLPADGVPDAALRQAAWAVDMADLESVL